MKTEIIGIKNKNGGWFISCKECGRILNKETMADVIKCECGWVWDKINKEEEIYVSYIKIK